MPTVTLIKLHLSQQCQLNIFPRIVCILLDCPFEGSQYLAFPFNLSIPVLHTSSKLIICEPTHSVKNQESALSAIGPFKQFGLVVYVSSKWICSHLSPILHEGMIYTVPVCSTEHQINDVNKSIMFFSHLIFYYKGTFRSFNHISHFNNHSLELYVLLAPYRAANINSSVLYALIFHFTP